MSKSLLRAFRLFILFFIPVYSGAQTTNTYTTSTTWTVPATVTTIAIKVYGGAGGTGGQDCGSGCTNAAAGPTGYVYANFNVTPGDVVGIYPGGKGGNGSNNVTGTGGGTGGTDTYASANYNGGNGGNAGSSGASGGGGGGGAASVVTINSVIKIVAGGAGGGGGMANQANSGYAGSSSTSSNGVNNGGNGTTPGGDGGGGGGGGGGQFASAGGGVHAAGGENAGNGGFLGSNSVSGASTVITNGNISWTSTGQIEITFTSTLPVTWLNFTAIPQNKSVVLNWSTSTEQNTKDYTLQRSTNASIWTDIGMVNAAGNSTTVQHYSFTDQRPSGGINYYRILQRDIDNGFKYSKVIVVNMDAAISLFRLYPNPVLNKSAIINLAEPAIAVVYNTDGTKLLEKQFSAGAHLFSLLKLPAGTYYLKVKDVGTLFVIQ
ncbi:MAG: T9SS type A sorting domain-containing protein [Sphingobacteriales bacterium]|nr:T9SS type A sorting domain-containing protein [Sphingobacteriales bacterium]